MKKFTLYIFLLFLLPPLVHAQKVFTKTGHISIDGTTPLEDIRAENYKVLSVIDQATGQLEFGVPIQAFDFRRALMQEHFNEDYMESSQYPQAIFKGNIENYKALDLSKDGNYHIKVKGNLTIHNITKKVEIPAVITVKAGNITAANATFNVSPQDYNIRIPSTVRDKIAKIVKVKVDMSYAVYKG